MASLFEPCQLGAMILPNRTVMAPMTRARSTQPGNIPNALMAEYYAQRAGAGLIVTEATQISPQGQGYSFTPGIHSDAQVAGWRRVTERVHAHGGRIALQLWHVGRMSHPMFHGGALPVAPSAIAPGATVWAWDAVAGRGGLVEAPEPRAMTIDEIEGTIEDFRRAAANAREAGFDAVEIHGANGYLIDQFLRESSNRRTDAYGGSVENRLRFAMAVARVVAAEMGPERTGFRLSPYISQRGMDDPDAPATILRLSEGLGTLGLAYIHIAEADWDDAPAIPVSFRRSLRALFPGAVIVAGQYDKERGERIIADGLADLVAFGRPFIANPDLPRRLAECLPLATLDPETLFGGDAVGYTDYPAA
ncbi:alkene reductase [Marivibrio halodurans]|uniref:Alkene reductase n=1 Tax=Marivibrio halodurans TaxID=2039722 RepID=A0A8J7SH57_9PROT|nr:alkene reductase [Marivibrio halodurans]MBP5856178.1 alkene reductase [Marivibrio halodurans]